MEATTAVQPQGSERAGQAVATALRAELARQNLSSADLANRLIADPANPKTYMDPRYVRRRVTGQIPLTVDDVQWFAAALGVPMTDLLAGIPSKTND